MSTKHFFTITTVETAPDTHFIDGVDMRKFKDAQTLIEIVANLQPLSAQRYGVTLKSLGVTPSATAGSHRYQSYLSVVEQNGYYLNLEWQPMTFRDGRAIFKLKMETDLPDQYLNYAKQFVAECIHRPAEYSTYCAQVDLKIVGWDKPKAKKAAPKCQHDTTDYVSTVVIQNDILVVVKCCNCGEYFHRDVPKLL